MYRYDTQNRQIDREKKTETQLDRKIIRYKNRERERHIDREKDIQIERKKL